MQLIYLTLRSGVFLLIDNTRLLLGSGRSVHSILKYTCVFRPDICVVSLRNYVQSALPTIEHLSSIFTFDSYIPRLEIRGMTGPQIHELVLPVHRLPIRNLEFKRSSDPL
jgi:hypothetical protein